MKVTDIELEALRKFNSGKNAAPLKNNLEPGTYPVKLTVTLEGELFKGEPGLTSRRNDTGSANIVRYLLDRLNDLEFSVMHRDLEEIRKGQFKVKFQNQYEKRLELTMPYREFPRAGSTKFNGQVIVEEVGQDLSQSQTFNSGLMLIGEK
mgnify:FL=1